MATAKQIAANQRNAKRSTSPKTAAGRAKSCRNAFRHGLSGELPLEDPNVRSHVNAIMQAVMADLEATDDNLAPITEYAKARVQLMRIRQVRRGIFAELRSCLNPDALSRLVALDRYERLAHTKRRRASQELFPARKMEG